ncbi:MAG: YqhA family protein [Candidatus Peribacteria bacterium]|nr:MAG: YqhA family protein [Candidatus Peribacteria bacterium]
MFIKRLEVGEQDERLAEEIFIHNIGDLKVKLGNVIIISLVVHVFKQMLTFEVKESIDMLLLSSSVVLVAGALFLISQTQSK